MFLNELELLDIRLHELDSVVDKFVLVESERTHSNKPKPLYFEENKSLFKQHSDKIIHVVSEFPVSIDHPWILEDFQRNDIRQGLVNCSSHDLILIADVDEIPRKEIFSKQVIGFCPVQMTMFYYYFNTYFEPEVSVWTGAYLTHFSFIKRYDIPLLRSFSQKQIGHTIIHDGGWHFSCVGGVESIQLKLNSFAHVRFGKSKINNEENIKRCMTELVSYKTRNSHKMKIENNIQRKRFLPEYIVDNKDKFKYMFYGDI